VQLAKIKNADLIISNFKVQPSVSARNLELFLTMHFSFIAFTLTSASTEAFYSRLVARIWDQLSRDLTNIRCASFVLSLLDYCDTLLVGLPNCSLRPLQRALNMPAHLAFRTSKSSHVTSSSSSWGGIRQ